MWVWECYIPLTFDKRIDTTATETPAKYHSDIIAVEDGYIALQYILILHTAIQWQQQKIKQIRTHKRHPKYDNVTVLYFNI